MAYPPVAPANGFNFTHTVHNDTYSDIDPVTQSNHEGHAVFITGASGGIGLATALSFARSGASHIALSALAPNDFPSDVEGAIHKAAKESSRKPPSVVLLRLDVLEMTTITAAVAVITKQFGKLDILVNNAGFMANPAPVSTSAEEDYWMTFEINLRGTYRVTKAFLPLLLDHKDGLKTIVNLNSIASHNLRPNASAYGTSKFAVLRFTEFLMVENAEKGLLAYCVHPGAIMTKLAEAMPKNTHAGLKDTPEMAADSIVHLTQKRREWLAGRYLSCAWDMPELMSREKEIVDGDKLKMRMVL